MEETFRDGLRAALTEAQSADVAPASDAVESPVVADASESASAPEGGDDGATESAPAPDGRARDSSGKFVKAEESASAAPKKQKVVAPSPTPKPTNGASSPTQAPAPGIQTPTPPPKFKTPPAAWGPLAKEHWPNLPEAIQEYWHKRESEMSRKMMELDAPQKHYRAFQDATAPYAAMIQASGSDPVKYVSNLMGTAYALQSGAPQQRAMAAAQIIKNFGVDLSMLDAALAGESPTAGQAQQLDPGQLEQQITERIMRRFQETQQQRATQAIERELTQLSGELEFFEHVREDMADLLDAAKRRSVALTPKDAYNRALSLHKADPDSEVGKVLRQRDAAKQAETAQAATQRSKSAATSLKSEPSGTSPGQASGTYRDELRRLVAEKNRG